MALPCHLHLITSSHASSNQFLPLSFCNSFSTNNLSSSNISFPSLGLKSEVRRKRSLKFAAVVAEPFGVGEDLPEDYGDRFPKKDPSFRRRAGVLLHPSSLPGPYGIGDLGKEAFRFLDWLHESGCSVWQVLSLSLSRSIDRSINDRFLYVFEFWLELLHLCRFFP